jgi:nicotinamide mononucleotide transporter
MPAWLATGIEWTAAAFGLLCVALTVRRSIWCWPTGLVQVLLYIAVFYQARLYSDLLLHVVYVVLQLYGWWAWLHGGTRGGPLRIRRLSAAAGAGWACAAIVGIASLGFAMSRWTDAALPYWDAATTVLSLVAQVLLARKILENWLVWILVDVLCIGIYTVKGLHVTTALYSVFLLLATMGLMAWLRNLKTTRVPAPA